jgi:AMP-binding enzyme
MANDNRDPSVLTPSRTPACFVAELEPEAIPSNVMDRILDLFVDWAACSSNRNLRDLASRADLPLAPHLIQGEVDKGFADPLARDQLFADQLQQALSRLHVQSVIQLVRRISRRRRLHKALAGVQQGAVAGKPDAQNLFDRHTALDEPAVVFWGEDKVRRQISHRELHAQVAVTAAALRAEGIVAGDRVAAFMRNMPETLVAMLAAASIGAVFTSMSPDFGV